MPASSLQSSSLSRNAARGTDVCLQSMAVRGATRPNRPHTAQEPMPGIHRHTRRLSLALLLSLTAPALGRASSLRSASLAPAARLASPQAAAAERTRGSLSALVIFAKFADEAQSLTSKPDWADDLFNAGRPGSFTHFYNEMSRGQLQVSGQVLPRRYSSREAAAEYVAPATGLLGEYGRFNREILEQADADADFGQFDNDGPDGVPNSGDDDGYVDVVFINLLTVPTNFFISKATGLASLGLDNDFISDDAAAGGGYVRVRSRFSGFGGTTQRGHVFSVTAATMCHEFGHVLGLPDLFDQSSVALGSDLDPVEDSAGIGKWGLMGLGTQGWGVEDGPNAFTAWTLMTLGWLGQDNELLVEVADSQRGVVLDQIDAGGKVYKVPISPDEYYLIENRQSTGSYYNRNVPGTGLLVWHVDERADNDEERHKRVDLVCADGLYADAGYPGTTPDPDAGRDNLDFWAHDSGYAAAHNGNEGDATDPFDGVRYTRFAADTNPGVRAHTGATRRTSLGFALENIQRLDSGRMQVDILVHQPVPGNVGADTTWSGAVQVSGDVVVEPGATLTLAPGTEVRFAAQDGRAAGFDSSRCELLVYGDLVVQGDAADPVTLRSARALPGRGDWLGVLLLAGQPGVLEALEASGGLVVEHAEHGLLRSRLPSGSTSWSGQVTVPWDIIVPAGSELVLTPGTTIRFAPEDAAFSGVNPHYTELAVSGRLVVDGAPGSDVLMAVDSFGQGGFWFGTVVGAGGSVVGENLRVTGAGFGLSGTVAEGGQVRLSEADISAPAIGVDLTIFDEVELEHFNVTGAFFQGMSLDGPGAVRLRETTVYGSGREGLFLGNVSLDGEEVRLVDNGGLDADDARAGLVAEGGQGQRLELRGGEVRGSQTAGLDLAAWEGDASLTGTTVSGSGQEGVLAGQLSHLSLDRVQVHGNGGPGVTVEDASVQVWESSFAGNGGAGLVLRRVSGAVEHAAFQGEGLQVEACDSLAVQACTFDGAALGLASTDASLVVAGNRFAGNEVALQTGGARLPERVSRNAFVDNAVAVRNLAAAPLRAEGNYWGTEDADAIAGLMVGAVDWTPFLSSEPAVTAVAEEQGGETPAAFALRPGYPNPFNSAVVFGFDVASPSAVELSVYDALGRRVRALVREPMPAGHHARQWDGRDDLGRAVASGVYLVRLSAGNQVQTAKAALLR